MKSTSRLAEQKPADAARRLRHRDVRAEPARNGLVAVRAVTWRVVNMVVGVLIGMVLADIASARVLAQIPAPIPSLEQPVEPVVAPDGPGTARYASTLVFDGTNDWAQIADAATSDLFDAGDGPFSIAMWVYPTLSSGIGYMFDKRPATNTYLFAFGVNVSGQVNYLTKNATAFVDLKTTATLNMNEWSYIGATRSGTDVVIYVNGVSETFASTRQDTITNTGSAALGAYAVDTTPGGFYDGQIANVRWWRGTVLSADQMASERANQYSWKVVTVTPTWGSSLMPGTGQAVTSNWGGLEWQLGSTGGVDDNDPTWGQRYRRTGSLACIGGVLDWLARLSLPSVGQAPRPHGETIQIALPAWRSHAPVHE